MRYRQRNRNRQSFGRTSAGGVATLDGARSGDAFEIVTIDDDSARMSALRFGMGEGAHLTCVTTIPAGPIVVLSGRQEIAVGRGLARRISIRHTGGEARGSSPS